MKPVAFVQEVLKLDERDLPASNVLLAPTEQDATAKAGMARIHVSKGSAAFVVNNGHQVCVMALHDSKGGDVSVLVGTQYFNLCAGEEAILTDESRASFKQANPVPEVAVRQPGRHELANGATAFICDFALPSAMTRITTISDLAHSVAGHDRALYGKMLKDAAVLELVTMQKGPYKAVRR